MPQRLSLWFYRTRGEVQYGDRLCALFEYFPGVADQSEDATVSTVADLSQTEVPRRSLLSAVEINELVKQFGFTEDEAVDHITADELQEKTFDNSIAHPPQSGSLTEAFEMARGLTFPFVDVDATRQAKTVVVICRPKPKTGRRNVIISNAEAGEFDARHPTGEPSEN
eukprot:IDg2591t1